MASNLPSNISAKLNNASSSSPTPSASQSGLSTSNEVSQKRSGSSFVSGSASRTTTAAPRKQQAIRSQNKQSRRYRLTDEDAFAESAAMNSTSSRKGQTSITHLMNFSLPPRPSNQSRTTNLRTGRRAPTWGLGSGYHAIDKARYVHANYRFVVDPRRDYNAQSVDADVYLDWSSILQILASPLSQPAACPICLGEPVAPRMAKCGHIFCLHCLIRFMHSTDDSQHVPEKKARCKSCPLCWDNIYVSETRPVRWYAGQEGPAPREGQDIVLRLVTRRAASTLALPRDASSALAKDELIPWHFAADVMDFARVIKGSEDYMREQHDDEIKQLEMLERHDELMFGEDTEWTGKAIRTINEAKEKLTGLGNPSKQHTRPEEIKPTRRPLQPHPDAVVVPEMYKLQHAIKSGQSLSTAATNTSDGKITPTDTNSSHTSTSNTSALSTSLAEFRAGNTNSAPASDYHFYHALLHYYLASLDIRILKAAFGDYSAFPSTILPRVERVSTGHVVDDDLRKRAKYLAHLPHGCEVAFLECDWTDTVPAEILERFKPELTRRRKRNFEKESKEEKDRLRAEKEEDQKHHAAARRRRNSSTTDRFRPEQFQPLVTPALVDSTGSPGTDFTSTSPMWNERKQNGSAFASLASPSTSPSASRTVWGTTMIAPLSPSLQAAQPDLPPADDGWLQGWERDLLQEDDLIRQVQEASLNGESSSTGAVMAAATVATTNASKKKKGKKITLMSTNVRRGA